MIDAQWNDLLRVLRGELLDPLPVGFIIDSPWLASWCGMTVMDYLSDNQRWLEANLRAHREFPQAMFVPGFWSEYGMCTEPSAFGSQCVFPENDFPFAGKTLADYSEIRRLKKPDCRTYGMGPFTIKRLLQIQPRIEAVGERIRFAVARGPMNIATFLLGHTETYVGIKTNPEDIHHLLAIVTDYLVDWVQYQASVFPSIDGILVLDDLIGFLGDADFRQFALPYLKRIFDSLNVQVKMLHNDCHGLVNARYLTEMGVNLFNFTFEHSLAQVREIAGPSVTLFGNIPPRDVLARGTPDDVRQSVRQAMSSMNDHHRLILSCGGATPPGVTSANMQAFCDAVRE